MGKVLNTNVLNKTTILQTIDTAKNAHKLWVKRAEELVLSINKHHTIPSHIDKTFIPLESTSCEFGQWLHLYAKTFSLFYPLSHLMTKIHKHHNNLHTTYAHIYHIVFVMPEKSSLLQRLLTFNQKKVSDLDREKAKIHLDYLKKSSKELLEVLEILEDKIKALDYNELRNFLSK